AETRALKAEGLVLHLLAEGDTYETETGRITPAPWRKATVGNEYADTPLVSGTGITIPGQSLADLLGEALVDNSAAQSLERLTLPAGRGIQTGLVFSFSQLDESQGYWGRDENGNGAYTIANIRLDIRPLSVKIEDKE
ncbi:MAG: hypothetical protein WA989_00895, partial [Henriciella sp.]|uniref:hypothetical protein n=1 Tax=Henriciella sp. TaxID=1968823 RepID=UPI003C71B731